MSKIKKRLIFILLSAILVAPAAFAAQQSPPPYPAQYWVIGTLKVDPADPAPTLKDYKVVLYSVDQKPSDAFAYSVSDPSGNFFINAFDDLKLDPKPSSYYIGVVKKDDFGVKQSTVQLSDQGYTVQDLTLKRGEGITDPIGGVGPALNIKVLLEGYYDPSASQKSKIFTVEVEARTGTSANTATGIAGRCTAVFDPADGYVKNPGNYWDIVPPDSTADPSTQYYLVVKHKLPGNPSGPNHLPIITKDKYSLTVASSPTIDLTTGDKAYQPTGNYLPALNTKDNLQMLWMGDYNGDQNLSPADIGLWSFAYKDYMDYGTYEIKADFNTNGVVDPADAGLWSFNYLQAVSKAAPNAYVP